MPPMHYARVYERYLFHGQRRVRRARAGVTGVFPIESPATADWLEAKPRLVVDLKATLDRCQVSVDACLADHGEQLRRLPCGAEELIASAAHDRIRDLCRVRFGDRASVQVLADRKHYASRRSLRLYAMAGVERATPRHAEAIMAALIPGIADDPAYMDAAYLLGHGPAFVWYEDGAPVGFAGVHRSAMSDQVGNVGMVFVKPGYRHRGGARALVSQVAAALLAEGRLPHYGCDVNNTASWRTAESVGFRLAGYTCRAYVRL